MSNTNACLTLTTRADEYARELLDAKVDGTLKMGLRFESNGTTHQFNVLDTLKVKDHVLQPRRVVIFVDPTSYEKGFGTDIDWDGTQWVFMKSERKAPVVAPKIKEPRNNASKKKTPEKRTLVEKLEDVVKGASKTKDTTKKVDIKSTRKTTK